MVLPDGENSKNIEKLKQSYLAQFNKMGDSHFYLQRMQILDDNLNFIPVSKINELRRTLLTLLSKERLQKYTRISQKPIRYADFSSRKIDYKGNVFNSEAKEFYKNCNCDVLEPALEVQQNVSSGIELMRTKHCLKFASDLCGKPCKKLYLVDANGKKYPLKFDCKNCEMVILSP